MEFTLESFVSLKDKFHEGLSTGLCRGKFEEVLRLRSAPGYEGWNSKRFRNFFLLKRGEYCSNEVKGGSEYNSVFLVS